MNKLLNPQVRAYVYRLQLAAVTLAAVYGFVESDKVAGWTALIAALVGNGLATLNTSVDSPPPEG